MARTLASSHSNRQIDRIAGWTGDGSDWTGGGKVPTSTLPLVRTEKVGFTGPNFITRVRSHPGRTEKRLTFPPAGRREARRRSRRCERPER